MLQTNPMLATAKTAGFLKNLAGAITIETQSKEDLWDLPSADEPLRFPAPSPLSGPPPGSNSCPRFPPIP
jgi:hypothetical protein